MPSFLNNLSWRYATKKFDGRTIAPDKLAKIFEAVRLAPTSFGLQPFHVTIVTDKDLREKIKDLAWGQEQVTTGSHLLVFSARTDISDRINAYFELATGGQAALRATLAGYEKMMTDFAAGLDAPAAESWAARQTYLALGFALAAAAELEIDACPMEGFNPAGVKTVLKLPEHFFPKALLALGYRHASEKPKPKIRFPNSDLFDSR